MHYTRIGRLFSTLVNLPIPWRENTLMHRLILLFQEFFMTWQKNEVKIKFHWRFFDNRWVYRGKPAWLAINFQAIYKLDDLGLRTIDAITSHHRDNHNQWRQNRTKSTSWGASHTNSARTTLNTCIRLWWPKGWLSTIIVGLPEGLWYTFFSSARRSAKKLID